MKVVKWILIVVGGLVVLLVAAAFMINPAYKVERTTVINAPPEKVYALVAVPAEWKRWSEWNRRDPNMKITYMGPPSGTGAGWAWESKSEGTGSMTFTKAEPLKNLAYALKFPDMGMQSTGNIALVPAGTGTKVSWSNEGNVGNPAMRLFVPFMDSMVGPDFEKGLANLKALAEKP